MSDRVERVLLLLDPQTRIGDPGNPSTWSVCGRHPTRDELEALASVTLQDVQDVIVLLELERSLLAVDDPVDVRQVTAALRAFLAALGDS